ncbi:Pantothenate synthetase [Planctomycetes bacterium Poly30]|uniref:Pantothenate synthetase n=1 Tax=Saltatorellus ferox TaxID=2528018 RepID=A0A518EWV2_9BACT|nr:Pantothenate synthetase [Planctomycetes bacterium Poly30]
MSQTQRYTAAIALGANLGEPERTFKRALSLLERDHDVTLLRRSHWKTTDPVGARGQDPYTNGAILVETTLGPTPLLEALRQVETHLGRDRSIEERWGPRTLDLDLLYMEDADGASIEIRNHDLVLPHPRMEERAFVLEPLADIAPDHVLPRSGVTVAAQLQRLQAGGGLIRLTSVEEARTWCRAARSDDGTLGFIPTMGALHEGHLDLVRRAAAENDRVAVSIFVNPLQFNDPADLERYPRDFEGDAKKLAGVGCSMVFTGTLPEFFPDELDSAGALRPEHLLDPGPAALGLEGAFRPGHFEGVATIVDRLFDVVDPTRAYFGAKDFQQCLVVEALAAHRGGRPQIVRCDIVRSAAGLALSSRNMLLSEDAKAEALAISRGLKEVRAAWRGGLRDASTLTEMLIHALDAPGVDLEYAEIRNPSNWTADAPPGLIEEAVALVAAKVGGVRLIDNMLLSDAPVPAVQAGA